MKNNRKGFTLAELLIVVAIIAVLVAIAIPVFSGALTKAQEAADEANVRAFYAESVTDYLLSDPDDAEYPSEYGGPDLNFGPDSKENKLTWEVDATGTLTVDYDAKTIDPLHLVAEPLA